MQAYPDLVVFSHLRWDFVYQRPQHLLSRMARRQRIFFIEEPIYEEHTAPHWKLTSIDQNITICRLHTPISTPGFHDDHLELAIPKLQELFAEQSIDDYMIWMYTPMALPLAQSLDPQLVIYDCMDELSAFMHAPAQLLAQEAALLQWADLVFTGGPSLYRAKRNRHPNVFCFPSSVDAAHFHKALTCTPAADLSDIPHPQLGFYGVIDERIDLELLDTMAQRHPEWQIVMVGPIVKINPDMLPKHPNIHYLGQRDYRELPSYLAGWDICLLPFALNDATRFISPTKTLEYMAAGRPIVSTPITDVVEPYSDIVAIGDTPEHFIQACERTFLADASEQASQFIKMQNVLAQTSWDATVQQMQAAMMEALTLETPTIQTLVQEKVQQAA